MHFVLMVQFKDIRIIIYSILHRFGNCDTQNNNNEMKCIHEHTIQR